MPPSPWHTRLEVPGSAPGFRVQGVEGTISACQNDVFGTANLEGTISACQNDVFGTANRVRCASGDAFGLPRRICACPAFWYPPKCESWHPPKFRSAGPAHKAAGRRVGGRAAAFRYPPKFASWYPPKSRWGWTPRRACQCPVPLTHVSGCANAPVLLTHVSTPPSPWHVHTVFATGSLPLPICYRCRSNMVLVDVSFTQCILRKGRT